VRPATPPIAGIGKPAQELRRARSLIWINARCSRVPTDLSRSKTSLTTMVACGSLCKPGACAASICRMKWRWGMIARRPRRARTNAEAARRRDRRAQPYGGRRWRVGVTLCLPHSSPREPGRCPGSASALRIARSRAVQRPARCAHGPPLAIARPHQHGRRLAADAGHEPSTGGRHERERRRSPRQRARTGCRSGRLQLPLQGSCRH